MSSDHTNKRYCFNLGEIGKLLINWHRSDNQNTRSAATTLEWNLGQCNGGYMIHVCDFIKLLYDVQAMQRAGYAMTDDDIRNLEDDVTTEDQFANFYGVGIFSMAGHRTRRNLKRMIGYPDALDLLNVPEKCHGIMKQFQRDCEEDYNYIHRLGDAKTRKCAAALERHLVHKVSVIQHLLIAKNAGWKVTSDQADVSKRHGSGLSQSQIIEDMIGHQKNERLMF